MPCYTGGDLSCSCKHLALALERPGLGLRYQGLVLDLGLDTNDLINIPAFCYEIILLYAYYLFQRQCHHTALYRKIVADCLSICFAFRV